MVAPAKRPAEAAKSAARQPDADAKAPGRVSAPRNSGTAAQASVMSRQTNAPSRELALAGGTPGTGAPTPMRQKAVGPSTASTTTSPTRTPSPRRPGASA